MTFDELMRRARKENPNSSWTYDAEPMGDGLWRESFIIETTPIINRPKLPVVERLEEKPQIVLPEIKTPVEQFIFNLRYACDLGKATKAERAAVERLIKKIDVDQQSKTISKRTPKT